MPLKIMNWNIQNLGRNKVLQGDTDDMLTNIAQTVISANVDIFIVLEVNTTDNATAEQIVRTLRMKLRTLAGAANPTHYRTYILAPNTGLEFYAFFIKDDTTAIPLTLTGGVATDVQDLNACTFSRFTASTDITNSTDYFPLIAPELGARDASRHPRHWTGTRCPCMGLFQVTIGAAPHTLAIFCCHFSAKENQAVDQIRALRNFNLLHSILTPPALNLNIQLPGAAAPAATAIGSAIITGDFNVDYITNAAGYAPITNAPGLAVPGIGFVPLITNIKTHLITIGNFNDLSRPKYTADLRSYCYDNFFVSPNIAPSINPGQTDVIDIPMLVRGKVISYRESLEKYAQKNSTIRTSEGARVKGVKGIKPEPYERNAYTSLNKYSSPRLRDCLIGARLISDHLPVVIGFN